MDASLDVGGLGSIGGNPLVDGHADESGPLSEPNAPRDFHTG